VTLEKGGGKNGASISILKGEGGTAKHKFFLLGNGGVGKARKGDIKGEEKKYPRHRGEGVHRDIATLISLVPKSGMTMSERKEGAKKEGNSGPLTHFRQKKKGKKKRQPPVLRVGEKGYT